ncbi:MAG: hypothetical protein M9927_07810 [Anaerolineae bacterium]|nr:hypothetical protein [Anaerolineae bacterium]
MTSSHGERELYERLNSNGILAQVDAQVEALVGEAVGGIDGVVDGHDVGHALAAVCPSRQGTAST